MSCERLVIIIKMKEFNFNLIGAGQRLPFGGYISEADKTMLNPRYLVKGSKNVYLKRSGTIANRPGLLRRGSADNTLAQVLAEFVWNTSLATTRPLRLCNGSLQVESDIVSSGTYVWYNLLTSSVTRMNFDTWWDNSAKKDILIFCDGTDDLKTWSGAIGLLDAVNTTATVIALTASAATLGFRSGGGTVIINGTEYTYGAISGNTLTGATDATGEANNSVVLDKPATDSNKPAADFLVDFLKVVNNQLYCGSDTSRLVYISLNSDYTDFTANSPRTPGDADILTLDEIPTGIGAKNGNAYISTRLKWYKVSFNQITVGSTLTEQTIVDPIPLSDQKGALRHEFIGNVGNDLVFVSQDQQLHLFSEFANITQPQFPSLSNDIKTELENEDFTGGHLKTAGDFIYLTAPNNGRVWLHETRTRVNENGQTIQERLWHAPFIWNISRISIIGGVEYGHSNANPQLYQMWKTLQWHDDSPSGDDLPYDSVASFAYRSTGRDKLLNLSKIFYEGYMTPGSTVYGALIYEYQGNRSVQQFNINSGNASPQFYMGDVGFSLGNSSLGDNPLGGMTALEELDQDLVPKFRMIKDAQKLDVFEYQPRIYSTEADDRWELLIIGANEKDSQNVPDYL